MHILLLVLKIIGIFILIVLGILLTLLLLVLFVPIRYKIGGQKEEQKKLKGRVYLSWLLHILSIQILIEEEIVASVRLFGIPIFTKKNNEDTKSQRQFGRIYKRKKRKKDTRSSDSSIQNEKENQKQKEKKPDTEYDNGIKERKESVDKFREEKEPQRHINQSKRKKNIFYRIWEKIIRFLNELKRKYYQILSFFKNVQYSGMEFMNKKEKFVEAWQSKENQSAISLLWEITKKLLQHITPKKWTGYIHFGMSNPESTGKVLGLISAVGGIIGVLPEIQPDFEQEIFEGKIMLKGRVHTFYLIRLFIRLWRKKEVHGFIDNIKKLW